MAAALTALVWPGVLPAPSVAEDRDREEQRVRHRQLAWSDFSGPPPPRGIATARIATAIVIDAIDIRIEPAETSWRASSAEPLRVYAVMFPLRSGVKPRGRNADGLDHEQGHFDLAEIQARRLAAELDDLFANGHDRETAARRYRSRIEAVHGQHELLLAALQQRYDEDTNHGRSEREQKRWRRMIIDWLSQSAARLVGDSRRHVRDRRLARRWPRREDRAAVRKGERAARSGAVGVAPAILAQ